MRASTRRRPRSAGVSAGIRATAASLARRQGPRPAGPVLARSRDDDRQLAAVHGQTRRPPPRSSSRSFSGTRRRRAPGTSAVDRTSREPRGLPAAAALRCLRRERRRACGRQLRPTSPLRLQIPLGPGRSRMTKDRRPWPLQGRERQCSTSRASETMVSLPFDEFGELSPLLVVRL